MDIWNDWPLLLALLGVLLLILEFAVLGFSTIFLVFISFACFGTALLQWVGILPETWLWSCASVAVQTAVFGLALWSPLRRMQGRQQSEHDQPNSINGIDFRLATDIDPLTTGLHQYSGVSWVVEVDESIKDRIPSGTLVVVTRSSVGKLFVRPVSGVD